MPQFTLGEIMSIATTDCGRRSDISVSVVSQRANMAYFEVANAGEFALAERMAVSSTTSGENKIDLPTDFGEPINLSMKWSWSTSASAVSSTKTLTRVSASFIDANGIYPVGEPEAYAFYNSWIELYPSPDSGYSLQIRYRSMVTDMVATSDIPSIATPARYAVLLKTKQFLYDYLGDRDASAQMEQQYLNYMSRLKSDEYRRQMSEGPIGLAPVYGSASGTRDMF